MYVCVECGAVGAHVDGVINLIVFIYPVRLPSISFSYNYHRFSPLVQPGCTTAATSAVATCH